MFSRQDLITASTETLVFCHHLLKGLGMIMVGDRVRVLQDRDGRVLETNTEIGVLPFPTLESEIESGHLLERLPANGEVTAVEIRAFDRPPRFASESSAR